MFGKQWFVNQRFFPVPHLLFRRIGTSKSARACATQEYDSYTHGSLAPLYKKAAAPLNRPAPTWAVNGSTGAYLQRPCMLAVGSGMIAERTYGERGIGGMELLR